MMYKQEFPTGRGGGAAARGGGGGISQTGRKILVGAGNTVWCVNDDALNRNFQLSEEEELQPRGELVKQAGTSCPEPATLDGV
jgi:hypothetical protein